jgi:hypothetical protein
MIILLFYISGLHYVIKLTMDWRYSSDIYGNPAACFKGTGIQAIDLTARPKLFKLIEN